MIQGDLKLFFPLLWFISKNFVEPQILLTSPEELHVSTRSKQNQKHFLLKVLKLGIFIILLFSCS